MLRDGYCLGGMTMRLLEEMKVRRLFCDGGMGSMLQARGLQAGEMPEMWT